MSYKVSILIPVFNAGHNLEQLICSIIGQTMDFNDIELILVDDKSSDNSKSIIEKYSSQYANIKAFFLKENSGDVFVPRNIALENATSDYLIFIDSDDLILPDYCETLYDAITEENADIVFCNESFRFLDGIYSRCKNSKEREIFKDVLHFRGTIWGNIFRKGLFGENDIEFPPSACADCHVVLIAYTNADRIIRLPYYNGYIYSVESEGEPSITHRVKKENISRAIEGYKSMIDYYNENNLNKDFMVSNNLHMLYLTFIKLKEPKSERISLLKEIVDFQKFADCNVRISSKSFDIVNKLVLRGHFSTALFLCSVAGRLYENRTIKNLVLRYISKVNVKVEL